MHKKFVINQTKIKGGCQSERKVATHNSKSNLPIEFLNKIQISVPMCGSTALCTSSKIEMIKEASPILVMNLHMKLYQGWNLEK